MEIEELKAKLKKNSEKQTKLLAERKKLLEQCPHEFEEQSYYFSGSYYDTAYTQYWDECAVCGKKQNKREVNHGWYG